MTQQRDPEKTWNIDDLDFDEEGRLVIKDESLIYYFEKYLMEIDNPLLEGECDGLLVPKCGGGGTGSPVINPECIEVPYGGIDQTPQTQRSDHLMFTKKRRKKQA